MEKTPALSWRPGFSFAFDCQGSVSTDDDADIPEVVELSYDGELDLHPFHPRDWVDVVESYLEECRVRSVLQVRVVHGKGTGAQKRRIAGVLDRLPFVERHQPAGERDGGWGATWVWLLPPDPG